MVSKGLESGCAPPPCVWTLFELCLDPARESSVSARNPNKPRQYVAYSRGHCMQRTVPSCSAPCISRLTRASRRGAASALNFHSKTPSWAQFRPED